MAHQTVSHSWDAELAPTTSGRTQAPSEHCPVEVTLAAISGRWTTLLLRNLLTLSPQPYSSLATSLPALSDKVLTDRLAQLARAGLVERTCTAGFPVRTSYRITERGLLLRPLLIELYRTGLDLQAHDTAGPDSETTELQDSLHEN